MEKAVLKLETLKISDRFNMQQLIEEHDDVLNAARDNGTTETIEELDKLHQNMEYKKVMLWKLVRIKTYLWRNLSHCIIILIKREIF